MSPLFQVLLEETLYRQIFDPDANSNGADANRQAPHLLHQNIGGLFFLHVTALKVFGTQ